MAISTLTNRNDLEDEPVIKAEQFLAYKKLLRKVPDSFIIVPFSIVLQLIRYYKIKKAGHVISGDIFTVSAKGLEVGIACPRAYGAPAIAMTVEELTALGAKRFILIGASGSLQQNIHPGSVILSTKALREEGVSCHYVKPSKYATPSSNLNSFLENSLKKNKIEYSKGVTWTTDAFYRETINKVKHYQKESLLCVDMEAAALFAVAKHHSLDATAMFYITDSLATLTWQPHFSSEVIEKNKILLFKVAVDALCMMKNPSFKVKPLGLNISGLALSTIIVLAEKCKRFFL